MWRWGCTVAQCCLGRVHCNILDGVRMRCQSESVRGAEHSLQRAPERLAVICCARGGARRNRASPQSFSTNEEKHQRDLLAGGDSELRLGTPLRGDVRRASRSARGGVDTPMRSVSPQHQTEHRTKKQGCQHQEGPVKLEGSVSQPQPNSTSAWTEPAAAAEDDFSLPLSLSLLPV